MQLWVQPQKPVCWLRQRHRLLALQIQQDYQTQEQLRMLGQIVVFQKQVHQIRRRAQRLALQMQATPTQSNIQSTENGTPSSCNQRQPHLPLTCELPKTLVPAAAPKPPKAGVVFVCISKSFK